MYENAQLAECDRSFRLREALSHGRFAHAKDLPYRLRLIIMAFPTWRCAIACQNGNARDDRHVCPYNVMRMAR